MIADNTTFLDAFLNELIRNIDQEPGSSYWSHRPKPEFRSLVQQVLIKCASYAVNACMFKLTHTPLMEHLSDLNDSSQNREHPWLFIIVDPQGSGLADSHDHLWSDVTNFAKQVPILKSALAEKTTAKAPFRHGKTGKTFQAIAFPLLHGDELVGAALIGEVTPPPSTNQ